MINEKVSPHRRHERKNNTQTSQSACTVSHHILALFPGSAIKFHVSWLMELKMFYVRDDDKKKRFWLKETLFVQDVNFLINCHIWDATTGRKRKITRAPCLMEWDWIAFLSHSLARSTILRSINLNICKVKRRSFISPSKKDEIFP